CNTTDTISSKPRLKIDRDYPKTSDSQSLGAYFRAMSEEEMEELFRTLPPYGGPSIPYDDYADVAYEEGKPLPTPDFGSGAIWPSEELRDSGTPEQILYDLVKENDEITAAITTAKESLDTLILRESVENPKLEEPRNALWKTEQVMVKPIDTSAKAMEAMTDQFLREREANSNNLSAEWDIEQDRSYKEVIREEWSMK
ncbi:hypothetical protein FQN49_007271, partial [Arthroderma sp. PD_2]